MAVGPEAFRNNEDKFDPPPRHLSSKKALDLERDLGLSTEQRIPTIALFIFIVVVAIVFAAYFLDRHFVANPGPAATKQEAQTRGHK